jgi:hypothetical protein
MDVKSAFLEKTINFLPKFSGEGNTIVLVHIKTYGIILHFVKILEEGVAC